MKLVIFLALWIQLFCSANGQAKAIKKCGPPPEIPNASLEEKPEPEYPAGTELEYKCDYGYLSQGFRIFVACNIQTTRNRNRNAVWDHGEGGCIPRSCGDPEHIDNAQRLGSSFTFPNYVEYVCNEGYKLSGLSKRYCQTSGTWSGKLPRCDIVSCKVPNDPENAKALYSSLEYDSELSYKCKDGYQISSNDIRICGPDGSWSGVEPSCTEILCQMPHYLENGKINLVGKRATVGSIVLYSCDHGRVVIGSDSAKCSSDGTWTFPTPKCSEPCLIPNIQNGEIIKLVNPKWSLFVSETKIPEGTELIKNEEVYLKCNSGYAPINIWNTGNIKITCDNGKLSPFPNCIPVTCEDEPPPMENGKAVVTSKKNGHIIYYNCDRYYVKSKDGRVECQSGSWKGYVPVCKDSRCYTNDLNYKGMEIPSRNQVIYDRGYIVPKCDARHELSKGSQTRIYCREGTWNVNFEPCVEAKCKEDPPAAPNARIKVPNVNFRDHSTAVEYECNDWFHMETPANITCRLGKWEGTEIVCSDTRCYLQNLVRKEGVDLTHDPPLYPNGAINVKCIDGYVLKYPQITCHAGNLYTVHDQSPCQKDITPEVNETQTIRTENNFPVKSTTHSPNLCRCVYNVEDQNVFAVIGNNVVTFNSKVISGSTIKLYCRKQEHQLFGPNEVTCPEDCKWHSSEFPSCRPPTGIVLKGNDEQHAAENSCLCTYSNNDTNVLAYHGQEHLQYNKKVNSGGVIKFFCADPKENLNGDQEVTCPRNCNWNDIKFPSCGKPADTETKMHKEVTKFEATDSPVVLPTTESDDLCWCTFTNNDSSLMALVGSRILLLNNRVPKGAVVKFACRNQKQHSLYGAQEVTCPVNCDWKNFIFPFCDKPDRVEEHDERKTNIAEKEVISDAGNDTLHDETTTFGTVVNKVPGTEKKTEETQNDNNTHNGNDTETSTNLSSFTKDVLKPSTVSPVISNSGKQSPCSCTYYNQDANTMAYTEKGVLRNNENVEKNSVVKFYCADVGRQRLFRGNQVTCTENCRWAPPSFPICREPREPKSVTIDILMKKELFHIGPGGIITIVPGSQLNLACYIKDGSYPKEWYIPYRSGITSFYDCKGSGFENCLLYQNFNARPIHSGGYQCSSSYGTKHSVEVNVQDVICPEIDQTPGLEVLYEQGKGRKFGSRATFHCPPSFQRIGSSFVTCQVSGNWSGQPAYCQLPSCSVPSLFKTLPEGIQPLLIGITGDTVPYNSSIQLKCDPDSLVMTGRESVVCKGSFGWDLGSTQCKSGCVIPLSRTRNSSTPIIQPEKSFYDMGDSVTLSCSDGKHLSNSIERVACLSSGWSTPLSGESATQCVSN